MGSGCEQTSACATASDDARGSALQVAPDIEAEIESKDSKESHKPKACSGILAGAVASKCCVSAQAKMGMMKWMCINIDTCRESRDSRIEDAEII